MKTKDFKKMSVKKQEVSYGGWAWLIAAIPLFIQTVMTAVSSYKMLESDNGSVKYNGVDARWDDNKPKYESSSSRDSKSKHSIFYSF